MPSILDLAVAVMKPMRTISDKIVEVYTGWSKMRELLRVARLQRAARRRQAKTERQLPLFPTIGGSR